VEYTFKNSLSEKAYTIVLGHDALTIQSAGREETVPYDRIAAVKLSRKKGPAYQMTIRSSDNRSITVSNKYHLSVSDCEDRSRQYAGFVRALHYHLKTKGSPVYTSGKNLARLSISVLLAAFFSFLMSFISEYFGWSVINPYAQSLLLTLMIVSVLLAIDRARFIRCYSPEQIPVQFLP